MSQTQEINRRALESLTRTLKTSKCPMIASTMIRDAFWQTLTKRNEPAPDLYEEVSLFEV